MANNLPLPMFEILGDQVEPEVLVSCNHVRRVIHNLEATVKELREAVIKLQIIHGVLAPTLVNDFEVGLTPFRQMLLRTSKVYDNAFEDLVSAENHLRLARQARIRAREALFHEEGNAAGGVDAEPGV